VRVDLQGNRGVGMPHAARDRRYIHPGSDQRRRVCITESMERHLGQIERLASPTPNRCKV
jgi:hypothetical protein